MSIAAKALDGRSSAAAEAAAEAVATLVAAKNVICSQRQAAANAEHSCTAATCCGGAVSLYRLCIVRRDNPRRSINVSIATKALGGESSGVEATALLSCKKRYPQSAKLLPLSCAAQEQQLCLVECKEVASRADAPTKVYDICLTNADLL